jgi:hypothetical protein
MFQHRIFGFLALALVFAVSSAHAAGAGPSIKKCQDAHGKWHYGDSADAECAQSKITIMSDQGVTKKEIAAPPTAAEVKATEARKDEVERERKAAEEQKKKDQILLSTYGHEDDIKFVRDRKLAQIEASIKASTETLKSLNTVLGRLEKQAEEEQKAGKVAPDTAKQVESNKNQIANREAEIVQKRKEQEVIRADSERDLARYRELKASSKPVAPSGGAKKP